MKGRRRFRLGVFGGVVALFVIVVLLLVLVFPYAAQLAVGHHVPLPIPRTVLLWWLSLLIISLIVYVLSSTKTTAEFFAPIGASIRGEGARWKTVVAMVVGVVTPLVAGGWAFADALPRTTPPAITRQQHPGTSGPSAAPYAGLENPFRGMPRDQRSEALATGRGLYFRDCAPCHGAKHDGDGPAARAQSLKPVSFRDPGTIATLVEDAAFWRVNEGAAGLPPVSTPWDSAMPGWHDDLKAEEIWQIILSEYADANTEPRISGVQ